MCSHARASGKGKTPIRPVIEMARKLLADAHKPTKIAGLKRLRSF